VVLLVALFLVNLPFVNEARTNRELARSGQDVEASVIDASHSGGSYLLDYRLPRSVDAKQDRYSARVDRATYERARESDALRVRVVPGKPAINRPAGAISSNLFTVVAVLGDILLLTVGLFVYRRWRVQSRHRVIDVDGDDVTLESARGRVTVAGPSGWARERRPGERVSGKVHLASDQDVVPGSFVGALEQVRGASYVVRGRVLDARAGYVVLELEDRSRLRVETGPHRIRADIRDPTEVRGTLCFTPSRLWG
jgi:hypothetical protein